MYLQTPMRLGTLVEKHSSILRNHFFKILLLSDGLFIIQFCFFLSCMDSAILVPKPVFPFNRALAVGQKDFRLCMCTCKVYTKYWAEKTLLSYNRHWRENGCLLWQGHIQPCGFCYFGYLFILWPAPFGAGPEAPVDLRRNQPSRTRG